MIRCYLKSGIVLFLFCGFAYSAGAQTFAEFFSQNKTQKKYLLKQIASLQVYIGYVEKGYKITSDGLNFIGDLKNGEFSLHKDYFNSLTAISTTVKNDPKIDRIEKMQLRISRNYRDVMNNVRTSAWNQNEVDYIRHVWDNLINECGADIEALTMLVTPDRFQLKEDERIKRVDALYEKMERQYDFSMSFSADIKSLAKSKQQEDAETKLTRWFYGQ